MTARIGQHAKSAVDELNACTGSHGQVMMSKKIQAAGRPKNSIFFASIFHAITTDPLTKIRLWASFGVYRSGFDGGREKNFFFIIYAYIISSSKNR